MAFVAQAWHEGEDRIHELTGVRVNDNPNAPYLTPRAASMVQRYSLLAVGTLDDADNIWCTVWGGQPPFVQPMGQSVLAIRTAVDAAHDPVVQALFRGRDDGEVVQYGSSGAGPMIAAVSIHLEARGRVKLFGRMIAGALSGSAGDGDGGGQVQLAVRIEQSLGNCPKYLNKKIIRSHEPGAWSSSSSSSPRLASTATHLTEQAVELIGQADLFFVASAHAHEDMDCNHRGGPPGFARVCQPADASAPTQIIWPEYSGNNLYQTLGNLMATPHAGIVVPNFETGDVLYLSGQTQVLVGADAARVMAKCRLAVCFTVTAARLVADGLPFRGKPVDDAVHGRSPYNPRIRYLTAERETKLDDGPTEDDVRARLIGKTTLTPTITRYRFALDDPRALQRAHRHHKAGGQYVALDFSAELDMGYSHMRDDDPGSLNDDYLRTFTVSSPPGGGGGGGGGEEFEITVRSVGRVTGWLSGQREGMVDVGVRGFAGDFVFCDDTGTATRRAAFVAAGIGITPLLGQATSVDVVSRLAVFWSLGVADVGLLADIVKTHAQLRERLTVFLTGEAKDQDQADRVQRLLQEWKASGWTVHRRRMAKADLDDDKIDRWYVCTSTAMRQQIQQWMPDTTLVYENFDY